MPKRTTYGHVAVLPFVACAHDLDDVVQVVGTTARVKWRLSYNETAQTGIHIFDTITMIV